MADYQSHHPNVVYTNPDREQVNVLYGGVGAPDGPGHGHLVYGIPKDQIQLDRPPVPYQVGQIAVPGAGVKR